METTMTDTKEPKIITDALAVIDKGLAEMLHRELVSTNEVADLLLDVRTLLAPARELLVEGGPVAVTVEGDAIASHCRFVVLRRSSYNLRRLHRYG